jgi:hypothetical protein
MIDVLLSKQFQAEAERRADLIYPNRNDPNAFWGREYNFAFAKVAAEYQREQCALLLDDISASCAKLVREMEV